MLLIGHTLVMAIVTTVHITLQLVIGMVATAVHLLALMVLSISAVIMATAATPKVVVLRLIIIDFTPPSVID
jgi:hypothetical protein